MLSESVLKLETENRKLRELLKKCNEDIPKPRDCEHCSHYRQHYCRDEYGTFYKVYTGFCTCSVPVGKRKGKAKPTPKDVCQCFKERGAAVR